MKKYSAFAIFCAFILTLTGCPLPNIMLQPIANGDSSVSVPSDEVYDVSRAQSGAFAFETLLPVDLSLRVNLIEKGSSNKEAVATNVIAQILDSKGNVVYTGMVNADGTIETQLQLPAAPEDMTLILTAQGFDERRIVIKDMRKYSLVKRTLAMKSRGTTSKALDAGMPDTDGDGVPDVYDAFPTDPDSAFAQNVPAKGALTISFEDLFGRAQAGDADYNDFLAQYKITLIKNAAGNVVKLDGEALAKVKLAGYNHRFGIVVAPFTGEAKLSVTYLDASGQTLPGTIDKQIVSGSADITLFAKTNNSIGCTTKFSLHFGQPQTRDQIDQPPYNPYLFVYNTGHDIHLIGETPLPNSINPGDTFRDSQGFPWALLVPDEWKYPDECQRIEIPYPRFTQWRESNGTLATDWYLGTIAPPPPPTGSTVERVSDIYSGSTGSSPANLTVYNGALYFGANGGSGRRLYSFNGSSAAEVSAAVTNPAYLTVFSGKLYFNANAGGNWLYSYDGTALSQVIPAVTNPQSLKVMGTVLYLSALDAAEGQELVSFDGTTASLAANINTTSAGASSNPMRLTVLGSKLYFSASDGVNGKQLWSYDGASASMAPLIGGLVGDALPSSSQIVVFNNALYFPATTDGGLTYNLWTYSGSGSASAVSTTIQASLSAMAVYDSALYLRATDGTDGYELYRCNGSSLSRVADINAGSGDGLSSTVGFAVYEGALYFGATDGSNGNQLWKYNTDGAALVKTINSSGDANPKEFALYDDRLYFQADDGSTGVELWALY